MNRFWYWAPRVLGILSVLYIGMFSLDVFAGPITGAALLGFLIHNIPTLILAVLLAIAWKWETVGGIVFILACAVPFGFLSNPLWVNALLALPFLITGILFLLPGAKRQEAVSSAPLRGTEEQEGDN